MRNIFIIFVMLFLIGCGSSNEQKKSINCNEAASIFYSFGCTLTLGNSALDLGDAVTACDESRSCVQICESEWAVVLACFSEVRSSAECSSCDNRLTKLSFCVASNC